MIYNLKRIAYKLFNVKIIFLIISIAYVAKKVTLSKLLKRTNMPISRLIDVCTLLRLDIIFFQTPNSRENCIPQQYCERSSAINSMIPASILPTISNPRKVSRGY